MFIINKKEFTIFASALRTYYPKEKLIPNEQAMELWYNQLKDIPYKLAEVILNKWVATNKWSPSIADIREQATELTSEEVKKDWGEAWNEVIRNIHYYGSYRIEEGMEHLTGITKEVVKRMGYMNLCQSENAMADRANFRDIYNTLLEREKQDKQIPQSLKLIISSIPNTPGLMIEGVKDDKV